MRRKSTRRGLIHVASSIFLSRPVWYCLKTGYDFDCVVFFAKDRTVRASGVCGTDTRGKMGPASNCFLQVHERCRD